MKFTPHEAFAKKKYSEQEIITECKRQGELERYIAKLKGANARVEELHVINKKFAAAEVA